MEELFNLDGKYIKWADEILLYMIVVEFQLFGTVWAMMNVSGKPYLLLYWGFVGLALVKLCIQGNTWKEWLFIIGFGVVALLSWNGSEDKTPLLLMLGVCCSRNVKLDRLIRVDLAGRVCNTILLIALPFLGVCENMVRMERGISRYYFGWQAPGAMGLSFLIISAEWMYLRHRRFRWYDYAGICAMLVFLDQTANSRSSEVLMVGVLCVELFVTAARKLKIPWKEHVMWALCCVGALCLDLLFFGVALLYNMENNQSLMSADGNLFSRFGLARTFYQTHGWTLFGSPYDPEIYDYLDIAFAYLTLHLGIVIAMIAAVLFIKTIIYGWKTRNERLLLLVLFFLMRSTIESDHFTLLYAPLPVFLGMCVWQKKYGRMENSGK